MLVLPTLQLLSGRQAGCSPSAPALPSMFSVPDSAATRGADAVCGLCVQGSSLSGFNADQTGQCCVGLLVHLSGLKAAHWAYGITTWGDKYQHKVNMHLNGQLLCDWQGCLICAWTWAVEQSAAWAISVVHALLAVRRLTAPACGAAAAALHMLSVFTHQDCQHVRRCCLDERLRGTDASRGRAKFFFAFLAWVVVTDIAGIGASMLR
ncbi:hypothetical protein COO60DRAFT_436322 [Scenedesmus sp. NREL 46B-D3]|nr:hypothetical protein COO60DRAFT_436322 [Scenedesmus sp. NREL 46B-D3]